VAADAAFVETAAEAGLEETGIRRSSPGGRRNDQPPIQIPLGKVDVARAADIAFGGL
jgi:hypothetical protein